MGSSSRLTCPLKAAQMGMPLTCSQLHVSANAFLVPSIAAAGWETTPPASPAVERSHMETALLFQGEGRGENHLQAQVFSDGRRRKASQLMRPCPLNFKTCIPRATKCWALWCRSPAPTPAPSRARGCSPAAPAARLCQTCPRGWAACALPVPECWP